MKKTLDESTITNELRGASAYFSGARHPQEKIESTKEKPIDRPVNRSANRSEHRSEVNTTPHQRSAGDAQGEQIHTVMDEVQAGASTPVRSTERYAFEIYTDQKRQLNRIRYLYEEQTGKKLAASRILREAIGSYLDELEAQITKP